MALIDVTKEEHDKYVLRMCAMFDELRVYATEEQLIEIRDRINTLVDGNS